MTIAEISQKIVSDLSYMRWQEWASTICQVASVWYARKNHIYVYPTGILGVLLAAWVYFFVSNPPLYADGSLNIYYFVMSVYGWYIWSQRTENDKITFPISWCDQRQLSIGLALFGVSWTLIYYGLYCWTNSDFPVLDSLVSSTAVTAMWWMAKRKVENWLAWIVSNLVAVPLNFYKGFIVFAFMYILFLALAAMGYLTWRKEAAIKS